VDMINDLDKKCSSDTTGSSFALPGAVAGLSDPKTEHEIPFPFTSAGAPCRFRLNDKKNWRYMGRQKFAELLAKFQLVQKSAMYNRLWVHGTEGYGKSHLLAALVCYLAALDKRVIYIPDCREWLDDDPVGYVRTAMLFAWPDKATQNEILALNTKRKIEWFLDRQEEVIFVIDQMNALSAETKHGSKPLNHEAKVNLRTWITTLTSGRKPVFSASANHQEYLNRQISQTSDYTMLVYGGLTEVCLNIG